MNPVLKEMEQPMSFEAALEKIRNIVTDLETGKLSLEESIDKYRAGSALIERTRQLIADAELRITELSASPELD
jgi:exodeoxyribonuclease VII small subunit